MHKEISWILEGNQYSQSKNKVRTRVILLHTRQTEWQQQQEWICWKYIQKCEKYLCERNKSNTRDSFSQMRFKVPKVIGVFWGSLTWHYAFFPTSTFLFMSVRKKKKMKLDGKPAMQWHNHVSSNWIILRHLLERLLLVIWVAINITVNRRKKDCV